MTEAAMTEPDSPRSRRWDATRDQILQHAADIVLEDGVSALSMRGLADRAGFTVGALYRYFPSADGLLSAVALQVFDRLADRLQASHDAASDPLAALGAMVDAYRGFAANDPHGFALVSQLLSERRFLVADEGQAAAIGVRVARALAPVCSALDAAVAGGGLAPCADGGGAMDRALALFAAVQGALLLEKLGRRAPGLLDADALARLVATSLFLGWGARPGAVPLRPPGTCA